MTGVFQVQGYSWHKLVNELIKCNVVSLPQRIRNQREGAGGRGTSLLCEVKIAGKEVEVVDRISKFIEMGLQGYEDEDLSEDSHLELGRGSETTRWHGIWLSGRMGVKENEG